MAKKECKILSSPPVFLKLPEFVSSKFLHFDSTLSQQEHLKMILQKANLRLMFSLVLLGIVCNSTLLFGQPLEVRSRHRAIELPTQPGIDIPVRQGQGWSGANKGLNPQSAPAPVYNTVGRDFYLVFLAAVGSDGPGTDSSFRKVYISSRSVTKVTITLMSGGWSTTVYTDPNRLKEIVIPSFAVLNGSMSEIAYNAVIHVESEDLVAVYAMSHNWLSSDGYLALPNEALGKRYVVASVRNALNYYGGYSPLDVNPRSEFAIAATANNTNITFTLAADSYRGRFKRGVPYTITLQRGQVFPILAADEGTVGFFKALQTDIVYDSITKTDHTVIDTILIQAYTGATPGNDCDLTGSTITSDQPIAVFSGHERATVPDSLEFNNRRLMNGTISRDHLVEQLPPAELWGQHFAVISSGQDNARLRPFNGDMIRVIAGFDSTVVKVNGAVVTRLQTGTFYQFMAGVASYVETSKPAMVMKYEQTAIADVSMPGDPDMTVVQPMENMSTFYTIPSILDTAAFFEHHLTLVVDTSVLTRTSWNGKFLPKNVPLQKITGTPYAWTIFAASPGQQHIESPKPCYAETFGFGTFDSYTLAGGGNFRYTDSLAAIDLDFQTILQFAVKDSLTTVYSAYTAPDLIDSITIYRYTWERGDSNAFSILDSTFAPFTLGPGDIVPAHFRFHPSVPGKDSAIVRVWSSSRKDVFIKLLGNGVDPKDTVTPKVLDFGRVRLGRHRDSSFVVQSNGTATVQIDFQEYSLARAFGFYLDTVFRVSLDPGIPKTYSARFQPLAEGFVSYSALVSSNAYIPALDSQYVRVVGRGVFPRLMPVNYNFGKVRLSVTAPAVTIPVNNVGSDTSNVRAVSLVAGDVGDFSLTFDSLPTVKRIWVDTLGVPGANWHYFAAFHPSRIGLEKAVVEIVTDTGSIFDTLSGTGAEPVIIAKPDTIDFGTTYAPLLGSPALDTDLTRPDTISNVGTFPGTVDSLKHTDLTDFSYQFKIPNDPSRSFINVDLLPDTLTKNTFFGTAHFAVTQVGDFFDTIRVLNDSRSKPIQYAVAHVRAGHPKFDVKTFELGTIVSCDSVHASLTIHNPYRITLRFDSIAMSGNTGGFSRERVRFPINIAPGDSFHVNVTYQFPIDSLNGDQTLTLRLFEHSGDDPDLVDTFTFHLIRKIQLLNVFTIAPKFTPSAGDEFPFRLPIYLQGNWLNRPELDSFTVTLQFPNDVFEPIGIDRTNSLTALPIGIPDNSTLNWDPIAHTYTITLRGQNISQQIDKSDSLLLTVLAKAFVTPDTIAIIQTSVTTLAQPCGFRFAPVPDTLRYASECGDPTIRSIFKGETPLLRVDPAIPNPVTASNGIGVKIPITAGSDLVLSWTMTDLLGNTLRASLAIPTPKGSGLIEIPASALPASGPVFVRIEALDSHSGAKINASVRIAVTK